MYEAEDPYIYALRQVRSGRELRNSPVPVTLTAAPAWREEQTAEERVRRRRAAAAPRGAPSASSPGAVTLAGHSVSSSNSSNLVILNKKCVAELGLKVQFYLRLITKQRIPSLFQK